MCLAVLMKNYAAGEKETLMGVSMLSCPGQKYINTSVSSLDQFEAGYLSLFTALIRADNVSE
jgi:hypothetical protein